MVVGVPTVLSATFVFLATFAFYEKVNDYCDYCSD